jgi:hypothetical protein
MNGAWFGIDVADHVEGGFRQVVVFAATTIGDRLERSDGLFQRTELAVRAGELLGHEERLRQEALDLAGAGHVSLSSSDSSSMPRMAMMSCRSL